MARSALRRTLVSAGLGAGAVILFYQTATVDSGARPDVQPQREFIATAYCKGQTTASGVAAQAGVAAADPATLPEGSIVRLDDGPEAHRGIYTVLDTGPKVQGKRLDLYMWSCNEALEFGRRQVTLTVLRRGWNPRETR